MLIRELPLRRICQEATLFLIGFELRYNVYDSLTQRRPLKLAEF